MKQRMGAVPAPCEDFWALKAKLLSIHGVLRSIHHVSSGCAQLSSAQNDTMIAWSRQVLLHIHHSLRELAWTDLSVDCVSPTPGDLRSTLAYPHYASGYLVRDVIDPLLDICSTQPGLELVPEGIVSTLQSAWSSIQLTYPGQMIDIDVVYIRFSGLEVIDARLAELRAAVVGLLPSARTARKPIHDTM